MTSSYTTTWNTGITIPSGASPEPAKAPKGLIVTRAVEVKDGWVGQVVVAEEIIWEGEPQKLPDDAEQDATYHVVVRIKSLLTAAHEMDPADDGETEVSA